MSEQLFYVGTFDERLYACTLDAEAGRLTCLGSVAQPRPSHLVASRDGRFLYVVSEMMREPGGVCAYDLSDRAAPMRISESAPGTQGPCHLTLTEDGRHLVGCSYFEGDVEVWPVLPDGRVGERSDEYRLTVDDARVRAGGAASAQTAPRAHGSLQVRGTNLILVADFSNDRVLSFRLSAEGHLKLVATCQFTHGEEVRHLAHHPTQNDLVYMLGQSADVFALRVAPDGSLTVLSGTHSLPAGRAYMSSAIKCSPDGRALYVSNRQNGNIAVLSLADPERPTWAGVIERTGFVRDLTFTPDGRHLLVGDQNSNVIWLYRMPVEGLVAERVPGARLLLPTPTCFEFVGAS